ncbi:class I SAM-dependent methyltransferase [soil metagenome]
MTGDGPDLVERGYDTVADRYLVARDRLVSQPHLDRLLARLPMDPQVLDVGCGAGVPVARYLTESGCRVTGIDVSRRQIELARRLVPAAEFVRRDMSRLESEEFAVDAVVSFYAIFHTPRERHPDLFERFASFLPPGGLLLVTMGFTDWEGSEDFFGAPMWWSHYDTARNTDLVVSAGFDVIYDCVDVGDERHQVILASRN